ncbi:MAG: M1 family aminopeptidase [Acidobacteriota bacterium]|nr:M1 family aminopeptidase [Acidobacteriota bacterium]
MLTRNFVLFLSLLVVMFSVNKNVSAQNAPPIEPGVSRELARWRAANVQDVRYKINLTLEKMSPTLKGTIEISLKTNADQIILDWRKIKGKEQFASVSNANINGNATKFEETNEHLVFKEGVRQGENVIKLDFTSPIATSGAAVTRYVDKEDGAEYIYSLFVPSDASTAFPVFDQPDLKARFYLRMFVPEGWKVVSNGKQQIYASVINEAKEPTDKVVYSFFETKPISTYVFTFAAGEFAEFAQRDTGETINLNEITAKIFEKSKIKVKNSPIVTDEQYRAAIGHIVSNSIYVRKSQAEKFKQHAAEVFRLNREAVKFLESYFDFKFPFPKYDLVLIPEFPFGGMEHAGATFLREDRIIFPQEPTANDFITRGNLIFHEAAHQWFGDTVTMRWFDDLWLKEGFAEFMAYKTMEKVLPRYNAWKAFYERNKPLAYLTDSTRGTTPIYQEIPNLSSAKSAYGNIVYRKAPSFLKQAEFYLGEDKFQSAVRAFLKQNAFKNAEWQDLVKSFEAATGQDLKTWAETWVKKRGMPIIRVNNSDQKAVFSQKNILNEGDGWKFYFNVLVLNYEVKKIPLKEHEVTEKRNIYRTGLELDENVVAFVPAPSNILGNLVFPNYQDYGYGIFLLDDKSRNYVLANIQNEKDDFLRSMMWGALWDSVREAELNPKDYVELAIKNISAEKDELTIQTILARAATAMNYYVSTEQQMALAPRLEKVLVERMANADTLGQRVTFYRAFVNLASTNESRQILKDILAGKPVVKDLKLKIKDRYDILTRLAIWGDEYGEKEVMQKLGGETNTQSDEERRYAYAAGAGIRNKEMKQYYFNQFLNDPNKPESWIESAFVPFNSAHHADLTLPYLEKALAELPNLKRNRKIFFVNGWLSTFIGGQRSEQALAIVNKFLADNPNLDKDLRLKVLENVDGLERAVRIRKRYAN